MMMTAVTVDFILANLSDFSFTTEVTVVLGLILGEVSKYLNKSKVSFVD